MSKWYRPSGRLGTVTVFPERKLEGDRRGPSAYITGITLWADGPDFIDTDALPANEIRELEKAWPDIKSFRTEVKTSKDKDGVETSTTEEIPFSESVWKKNLDQWLMDHAGMLGLVQGVPVQPVKVDNLSAEELSDIILKRQERALAGAVVYSPPAQKVKHGMRQV